MHSVSPIEPPAGKVHAWLQGLGLQARELRPLPGDVSIRRYLRVDLGRGRSGVLAVYPPAIRRQCSRFAATTSLLEGAGVRVPAILAKDCRKGLMLLEDVGAETLYDIAPRGWPVLRPYYELAAELIDRIAALPTDRVSRLNPPLDASLLQAEVRRSWDLYLLPNDLVGNGEEARSLERALETLCRRLGKASAAPCHRDLMVRNLVPVESPRGVAVLDHQDLRLGPPFYDLASLLNDTLAAPSSLEEHLLSDRLHGADERLAYRRAAAQRLLKIVGTFESFARQGDTRHRHLIAPSLRGALRHLAALPETSALAAGLAPRWRAHLELLRERSARERRGAGDLLD